LVARPRSLAGRAPRRHRLVARLRSSGLGLRVAAHRALSLQRARAAPGPCGGGRDRAGGAACRHGRSAPLAADRLLPAGTGSTAPRLVRPLDCPRLAGGSAQLAGRALPRTIAPPAAGCRRACATREHTRSATPPRRTPTRSFSPAAIRTVGRVDSSSSVSKRDHQELRPGHHVLARLALPGAFV